MLNGEQVEWLNRATGSTLPLPGKVQENKGKKDGIKGGGGKTTGDGGENITEEEAQKDYKRRLEMEDLRDEQQKELLIADALRIINPLKPTLMEAFDLELTTKSGKTQDFQAKEGDQSKVAEVTRIGQGDTVSKSGSKKSQKKKNGPPPPDPGKIEKEARQAFQVIDQLRTDLEARTTTRCLLDLTIVKKGLARKDLDKAFSNGPAQPLFKTSEIMDEVFTPLVRERVMPDGFITGKYSKTQQMINASNELYKQELKDATDPGDGIADFASALVDVGADVATGILAMAGHDTTLATTLLTGTQELLKLSINLGDKLRSGLDVQSLEDFLNGLPSIIGSVVGAALNDQSLGDTISTAGSAGTAGITIIVNSVKARKPDANGFVTFLSAVITAGLTNVPSGTSQQQAIVSMTNDIQSLAAGAASKQAQPFVDALTKGDLKAARKCCQDACVDFAMGLATELPADAYGASSNNTNQTVSNVLSSTQSMLAELMQKVRDGKASEEDLRKQFDELAGKQMDALGDKVEKDEKKREANSPSPEEVAKAVTKQIDEERKAFNDELDGLNDATTDHKKIMNLIAKIQRDRAILSVAVAIGKGGIDIASQFLAPLAIGTEAIKMAANIAAAVQRAVDLRKFIDEKAGAKSSTSPYLTSIQNFVDNQENQLTHYSIAAALNGVKITAAVIATLEPKAAPILPVVSGIQAAAEAIYQFYNATQVKRAWNQTKKSLDTPDDRVLALKVRKMNATLAKYTLAYGAVVERDPIAIHMMGECGLEPEMLKEKDTNAVKVKKYLEIKFADDPKVVGKYKVEDPAPWTNSLPEPALDAGAVFKTYKIIADNISEKNREKLKGEKITPPGELIGLIRTLQKQPLPEPPTLETMQTRLSLYSQLTPQFHVEKDRLGPAMDEVSEAIESFADVCELEQQNLATLYLKARVAQAKGDAPPKTN